MDPLARRSGPLSALPLTARCPWLIGGGMSNDLEQMTAAFDPRVHDLASRTRALINWSLPRGGGGALAVAERGGLRRRPEEDERALLLHRPPRRPREPGLQPGRGTARPGGSSGRAGEDATPHVDSPVRRLRRSRPAPAPRSDQGPPRIDQARPLGRTWPSIDAAIGTVPTQGLRAISCRLHQRGLRRNQSFLTNVGDEGLGQHDGAVLLLVDLE